MYPSLCSDHSARIDRLITDVFLPLYNFNLAHGLCSDAVLDKLGAQLDMWEQRDSASVPLTLVRRVEMEVENSIRLVLQRRAWLVERAKRRARRAAGV